jgi:glycosyltransferase involved in cell wall biosynthesis
MTAVTIDLAGGELGGAARYRAELTGYLERRPGHDIKVIGARRHLTPVWLATREASAVRRSRRVALNNVGFMAPGGERWTLLRNALHFLSAPEAAVLHPALRVAMARQAWIVRRAARRSDVLVVPCTAMAERIAAALPDVANRVVVRMHPVSVPEVSCPPGGSLILCPVLFAPYKDMAVRITEWLAAVDDAMDDSVRLIVTESASEVPASLAASPRLHFVGRLSVEQTQRMQARCRAVYFPPGLESFGYPLAEARVAGWPVMARDTPQNREIAGPALCGYDLGDRDSLRLATEAALSQRVAPDPEPFDPDAYFDWMLGGVK